MRYSRTWASAVWIGMSLAWCWSAPALGSEVENPMFSYTHLLPSPYTLGAGQLSLGTEIAYGVTDFLQVGTGLLADINRVFNASAKVALLDFEEFALAATLGWQSYNLQSFDASAPDSQVTSWLPGLVAGVAVAPTVAAFFGGSLNFTAQEIHPGSDAVSGYFRGASIESDLSWAYHQPKKSDPYVLSGGVSYDFTYNLMGFGISHYFKYFRVGVHYYPGSTRDKFVPIIAGGAVVEL